MQGVLAHKGLLPSRLLVKMPHCVMIITPFDFCRAASTLYGDIAGEDLDISLPKKCPDTRFLPRECPHGPVVDSTYARKVFGCQERSANQEVRGSEKKDERHAVHNDVLGELLLRVVTPVSRGGLARRGGLAGRAQDLIRRIVSPLEG